MIIKQGTTLSFSTGEYSDYYVSGVVLVLKDIDQRVVVALARSEWKAEHEYSRFDTDDLVGWLNRNGYIEDVPDQFEWHVGSYGEVHEILD